MIHGSICSAAVSLLECKGDFKVTTDVACREFAKMVEANAVAQLPEAAFEVDPGLRDIIESQIKQEEEAVRQVRRRILPLMPAVMLL